MRSITAKAACTLFVTILVLGLFYLLIVAPPLTELFAPSTSIPPVVTSTPTAPPPSTTTHTHSYNPDWVTDSECHWHICGCGEKSEETAHVDLDPLDHNCDTCGYVISTCADSEDADHKCDYCSADNITEHSFSTEWISDEISHWYECACGERSEEATHANENTTEHQCSVCLYAMSSCFDSEDADHKCDICGVDNITEHSFSTEWISDEASHWYECACGEKSEETAHADLDPLDHNCDTCGYVMSACADSEDADHKCDYCGADNITEHSFSTEWISNETSHWHECACGEKSEEASHMDATTLDHNCDSCGFVMSTCTDGSDTDHKCDYCGADNITEHSFSATWTSDNTNHWNVCACGEIANLAQHKDVYVDGKCDVCLHAMTSPDLPQPPSLNSKNAFIFDCGTNEYLLKTVNDLTTTVYPASITKVFTVYVALQYMSIEEEVLLGDEQSMYKYDAGYAGLKKGQTVSVDVLVHLTLMRSGSDATYGLAVAAGRKILKNPNASAQAAIDAFLVEMNRQAQALGMGATNFVTVDGYHDKKHTITFYAYITIARCAMSNEHIMNACKKATYVATYKDENGNTQTLTDPISKKNVFTNSNELLQESSRYYITECVGLKTGNTSAAGKCFLGVFKYKNRYIIIGTFGASSETLRWQDLVALWDYYLECQKQLDT